MLGAIGNGDMEDVILFEVSDEKILTFQNFVRSNSVRFSKNDVLLKKPVNQFIGPELDDISFDIKLMAEFGVNPVEEMNKLIILQRDGALVSIFVGNMAFGMYRWVIKSLTNTFENIDNKGNVLSITTNLGLQEYI